jgi:hypothetical protein
MNTSFYQISKRAVMAGLLIAAATLFSSCNLFLEKPKNTLVLPKAVVPHDFLFSWDKEYNAWMDTPNQIHYHKVPITEVFQNAPFTKLEYELQDMPDEAILVTFDSLGITRRQLLWALGNDYNLKMNLRSLPDGKPETIIVRWRN